MKTHKEEMSLMTNDVATVLRHAVALWYKDCLSVVYFYILH